MKKNFLKSALSMVALESIDSATQVAADEAQAKNAEAGANLPEGAAAPAVATTLQEKITVTDADAVAGALVPANEAMSDRLKGFWLGTWGGGKYGAEKAAEVSSIKQEIEHICQKIYEVSQDAGKAAVKEGKLTAADFKKDFPANADEVKKGLLRGLFLKGWYGASKNNELAELKKKLDAKMAELDSALKAAVTPANESTDDADAAAAATAGEGAEGGEAVAATPEAGVEVTTPAEGDAAEPAPAAAEAGAEAGSEGGEAAGSDATAGAEGTEATDAEAGASAADGGEVAEGAEAAPTGDAEAAAAVDAAASADAGAEAAEAAPADLSPAEQTDPAATEVTDAVVDAPSVVEGEGEGEPDLAAAEAEQVDAGLAQVDAEQAELASVSDDMETLNAANESLENCSAILAQSLQRGGLDAVAGALARNNVNTVTRNLKIRSLPLPALEDMESPEARIDATSTAKSQVDALIATVSNTVRTGLERFMKWLSGITAQLTDVYTRLEKRADLLAQRAGNATGDKTGDVSAKGLVAGGSQVANVSKFLTDMEKTVTTLGSSRTYAHYVDLLGTAEEMVKSADRADELGAQATQELLAFRRDIGSAARDSGDEPQVHFLGNRTVKFSVPGSLDALDAFKSSVEAGEVGEGSQAALKQKEVVALCEQVKAMAGRFRQSVAESNGTVKALNKQITDKMGVIVDLSKRLDSAGEGQSMSSKVSTWISRIVGTSARLPVHAVYAEVPRTLSIALDFAAASIGDQRPAVSPEVANAK